MPSLRETQEPGITPRRQAAKDNIGLVVRAAKPPHMLASSRETREPGITPSRKAAKNNISLVCCQGEVMLQQLH